MVQGQAPDCELNEKQIAFRNTSQGHHVLQSSLVKELEMILGHPSCEGHPASKQFAGSFARMLSTTMGVKDQFHQGSGCCQHVRKS
eukprot:Skav233220  [mRNA]  locus=scaffold1215:49182:49439:- [translate_table: standard]